MFANLLFLAAALAIGITATPVHVQSQAREFGWPSRLKSDRLLM